MVRRHGHRKQILFLITDVVILNVLYHVTFLLRFNTSVPVSHSELLSGGESPFIYFLLEAVITAAWILNGVLFRLYGERAREQFSQEALRLLRTLAGSMGVVFLTIVFTRLGITAYSRLFLFLFFGISAIGLILWRGSVRLNSRRTNDSRNILVVGAGKTGVRFFERLQANRESGYKVIGFLDNNGIASKVRPMILGKLRDLNKISEQHTIDEVVIALPTMNDTDLGEFVADCENLCIRVNIIPNEHYYDNSKILEGKMAAVQVGDIPLISVREDPLDQPVAKFIKRGFDIMFSALVLTLIFPIVWVFAAIGIKLTSKGPIFFRQERTGENNKVFSCFKFRSMRLAHRNEMDSIQALPGDSRITTIGAFLRRTSLDELPQFWNVLKGDMSIVGPRPHMVKHTNDYRSIVAQYMVRHFVKPGVTGWAQVNGLRGATETPAIMQQRIEHDVYYIEHWSFWFDVRIILMTIWKMFTGDNHAY